MESSTPHPLFGHRLYTVTQGLSMLFDWVLGSLPSSSPVRLVVGILYKHLRHVGLGCMKLRWSKDLSNVADHLCHFEGDSNFEIDGTPVKSVSTVILSRYRST